MVSRSALFYSFALMFALSFVIVLLAIVWLNTTPQTMVYGVDDGLSVFCNVYDRYVDVVGRVAYPVPRGARVNTWSVVVDGERYVVVNVSRKLAPGDCILLYDTATVVVGEKTRITVQDLVLAAVIAAVPALIHYLVFRRYI